MLRFIQLIGILVLAALLFAVGTISVRPPDSAEQPTLVLPPQNLPYDDLPAQADARPAIVEYGAVNVLKNNGSLTNPADNNFHVYIAYPQAGHSTDYVIREWVENLYYVKHAEFEAVRLTNPNAIGEVNVHFDSYLVDNRYVGILFYGTYAYELTPDFDGLIQTFNIDLSRNIFLETTDILDPLHMQDVISLLVETLAERFPETAFYLDTVDETWLTHIIISHRGIIVYLPQGEFLPDYFPTLSVTLTYRNLGPAVLIRTQPPLSEPPLGAPDYEPIVDVVDHSDDYDIDYAEGDDGDDTDDADNDNGDEYENDYFEDEFFFIPDIDPQRPIIDGTRPIIALTFDHGPGQYIDELLDLFEQYNIRATFSVVGNLINTNEEALVRASLNGNEIIANSWDHRNLAKLSESDVRRQILDTTEAIRAVTGIPTSLVRPPYGEVNDTMRSVAAELGLTIVNWSLDSLDWRYEDVDALISYVVDNVGNRDIVLSHASYRTTLEAYRMIIPILISRGYQFVTVSELLQWSQIIPEPGEVIMSG